MKSSNSLLKTVESSHLNKRGERKRKGAPGHVFVWRRGNSESEKR